MDRSQFARCLADAIISAVREFRMCHPSESPYAFAIICDQRARDLSFAIATEQALRQTAAKYDELGYRYQGFAWQQVDNTEELAVWLRWANPDDGWIYGDFPPRIAATLSQLGTDGAFGDEAEQLEEFYTDVLVSLATNLEWQQIQNSKPLVVGVTYGEDPRDFLRTATRCNPFNIVRELWAEMWRAEEHESRITAPR
ncbi:MAG TPA: DUF4303 domain-containing protein [Pirellulales bacterium]